MVMIPTGPGERNNYQDFARLLKGLVADQRVRQDRVDDAVRRILRVKFQMGLFEEPFADRRLTSEVGCREHRAVARECVRQSLVLLKNDHAALPLAKNVRCLLVAGKAANDLGMQCGGWTIDWQGRTGEVTSGGTTILAAIRQAVSAQTEVIYAADGAGANGADAAVVVVGEQPYAEMKGDRTDLRLDPNDVALIERVKQAGIPVVTVLLSGRPLILGTAVQESDALVAAWLPGTEGEGVADVLFGDCQPRGKLPCAWPEDMGHLAGQGPQSQPLFAYGFGLTYNRMDSLKAKMKVSEAGQTSAF
jgi:beta-glucosidase